MKFRLPLSSLSRYATEWLLLGGVLLLVALILGLFVAQKHQEIGVHERDRLALAVCTEQRTRHGPHANCARMALITAW